MKVINDNFGHHVGEQALVSLADVLRGACRTGDIIIRYGGDEFVIILYNTVKDDLEKIVDRIKTDCKNTFVDHIPLSVALGYATKDDSGQDIKEVFREADIIMYENKYFESRPYQERIIELAGYMGGKKVTFKKHI